MDKVKFFNDFFDQFESTDKESLDLDTKFRDLDEWDSLTALAVLSMIKINYGKAITTEKFKTFITLSDIFNYLQTSE